MKKLLMTAAALLALATPVQAQPAEPNETLYRVVRGVHIFDFFDRTCKPGSLTPSAKRWNALIMNTTPSDLNSRIAVEIATKAKEGGSTYCAQLERELNINSFNASANSRADRPGGMESARADLDEFIAHKEAVLRRDEELRRQAQLEKENSVKPWYILGNAYVSYIVVKRCHELRQGYLSIFISDPELVQARRAVQRMEKEYAPKLEDVSTDQLWSLATERVETTYGVMLSMLNSNSRGGNICQMEMGRLRRMSPDTEVKKDF